MMVLNLKEKFPKVYSKLKEFKVADHWAIDSRSTMVDLNFLLRGKGLPEWDGGVKAHKVLKKLESVM